MADLTQWKYEVLYPAVFNNAATVFPEHEFKEIKGDWCSAHYLDGNPHPGKRPDKTKINKRKPHLISEWGGESLQFIDYVMRRDKSTFWEALTTLSQKAGVSPPVNETDEEAYKSYRDKIAILEELSSYFAYLLLKTDDGKKVLEYLVKERGYTIEEIEGMDLGFAPSQDRIKAYLLNQGHSIESINKNVLDLLKNARGEPSKAIGITHVLTIPFRSGGHIKGFKFRSINPESKTKYLNTIGLSKVDSFFNISPLKGDKDLIIVEGELDALYATVNGIENVVSLAGSDLNLNQIIDAKKKGAKKITLCFDYEPGGKTQKSILKTLETLKPVKDLKIYVALFDSSGDAKIDPDSFIRSNGIEAFKAVLASAEWAWRYQLNAIISDYSDRGDLTPKDYDELRERIYRTGSEIEDRDVREQYLSAFAEMAPGISKESIEAVVDQLRYKQDREDQKKALDTALKKAKDLLDKGEEESAIDILKSTDSLRMLDKATAIKPYSFDEWEKDISEEKPALKTGFTTLDKIVRIPQGAITLIAGRPSHGKTTFMFNLMLRLADQYDGSIYFFSYEERKHIILLKILNSLINRSFRDYYHEFGVHTNTEYIKKYLSSSRTNHSSIEEGKSKLNHLLNTGKIVVTDQGLPVEDLCQLIRSISKEGNTRAIFCDYIQKMNTKKTFQDMRLRVAHISNEIQRVAVDTGLPIILGAQFNRGAAGSPSLEGLKEAGNLEEDANLVLSVYDETREPDYVMNESKSDGEVNIQIKALKNRDGEVNSTDMLIHDKWTQKFKTIYE